MPFGIQQPRDEQAIHHGVTECTEFHGEFYNSAYLRVLRGSVVKS